MVNEHLLRNRDNLIAQGMAKGIEKGIKEGTAKTQIQSLKLVITAKFPNLPAALDEILNKFLSKIDFSHLLQQAAKADSWNDFIKGLPNH